MRPEAMAWSRYVMIFTHSQKVRCHLVWQRSSGNRRQVTANYTHHECFQSRVIDAGYRFTRDYHPRN